MPEFEFKITEKVIQSFLLTGICEYIYLRSKLTLYK